MSKVVKLFEEAFGKQRLWDAVKAGGYKVVIDGTLAETMIVHGPGGKLVGEDQFGNKYYEDRGRQTGRDRWVVYARADDFRKQEPSALPAEWHGWINHLTDECPANSEYKRLIYAVEATANLSGGPDRHLPKGAWFNPEQRHWLKYEAWKPPRGA